MGDGSGHKLVRVHTGGCQNYGPFLGILTSRCRIIIETLNPKET